VALAAKKVFDQVQASATPNIPIIWSEYNATYMSQPEVTDSAFMGPWLANNIRECDGLTSMMSYWSFSDVFEEQGVVKTPFYGGYGLIAERSIPKASFRAFELLHTLGDRRLPIQSENALVTKSQNGHWMIALWNYAEPGDNAVAKTFTLSVKGAKKYSIRSVGPASGSALEAWKKLGSPVSPTPRQIQLLVAASALPPAQTSPANRPIVLGPQTLAVLELNP
jgi:xylan 1,4-beta-xylosidase